MLFVGFSGLAQFAYNGLAYQYLWPGLPAWNNRSPNILGFAALCFSAVFTRSVLNTRETTPRFDLVLIGLATASAIAALLSLLVLRYAHAVKLFLVLGPIGAAVMFFAGVVCLLKGYRAGRYFLLA